MLANLGIYTIVNNKSQHGLLAGSYGKDTNDKKVWQYPLSDLKGDPKNIAGFKWLLLPTDEPNYIYIINSVSGLALLAGSYGKDTNDKKVWQYPLSDFKGDPKNIAGFKWQLIDSEGNTWDGKTDPPTTPQRIVNAVSGSALLAGSYGKDPSDRVVWQYPLSDFKGDPKNIAGFEWCLHELEKISFQTGPNAKAKPTRKTTPKLNSLAPKDEFPPFSTKSTYLPCWMVTDSDKDFLWKLKYSPYYELQCVQSYKLIGSQENRDPKNAITQFNLTTVKLGWTKEQSTSFSRTVGFSTTIEESAGVEGVASIKNALTYSLELGFTASESLTQASETTYTPVIPYIPPLGVAAVYAIQNSFNLKRKDGTLIKQWQQVNQSGSKYINLVYPS